MFEINLFRKYKLLLIKVFNVLQNKNFITRLGEINIYNSKK